MTVCPCCGAPLKVVPDMDALRSVPLTPEQAAVLNAFLEAHPRRLGSDVLIDIIYGHRPDGGPETARKVIGVHLNKVNRRIAALGWRIGTDKGKGDRSGRHLLPVEMHA